MLIIIVSSKKFNKTINHAIHPVERFSILSVESN